MVLVFLVLVLIKYGVDYSIHGPDKEALREMQELTAEEYKPSASAHRQRASHLNLKNKGVHYLIYLKNHTTGTRGISLPLRAHDYMKIFSPADTIS